MSGWIEDRDGIVRYLERSASGQLCVNVSSQTGTRYLGQVEALVAGDSLISLADYQDIADRSWGGAWPISMVDAVRESGLTRQRLNQLTKVGSLSVTKDGPALIPDSPDYGLAALVNEIQQVVGEANQRKAQAGAMARWTIVTDTSSGSSR